MLALLLGVAFENAVPRVFTVDSGPSIRDHALVDEPWPRLFATNYWYGRGNGGLYRPVTLLSYRLERSFLGFEGPVGHARVNLLLHAVAVFLLWRVALIWLSATGAATAAALFAVHPVASYVIPNLVGRADLLAVTGALGAGLLFLAYLRSARLVWLGAGLGLWLLALLAKEIAVMLAPLLCFAALLGSEPVFADSRRRRQVITAGICIASVAVAWAVLRTVVLGQFGPRWIPVVDNPLVLEGTAVRVMTAVRVFLLYLGHAFWPSGLSPDYSFAQVPLVRSATDLRFLAGVGVAVALLFVCVWIRRRNAPVAFGIALFVAALIPGSNLLLPVGTIMGDRLLYASLLGLALCFGVVVDSLAKRFTGTAARAGLVGAVGILLATCLGAARARNGDWLDELTVWRRAAAVSPMSAKAQLNLAVAIDAAHPDGSRLAESLAHVRRSCEIAGALPGDEFLEPFLEASRFELRQADSLAASESGRRTEWQRAVSSALRYADIAIARQEKGGRLLDWWQGKRQDEGPASRGEAPPVYAVAHLRRAGALNRLGRLEESIASVRRGIEIDPSVPSAHFRLAAILWNQEQRQEARTHYMRGLAEARVRGRYDEAVRGLLVFRRFPETRAQVERLLHEVYREWVSSLVVAGRHGDARQVVDGAVAIGLEGAGLDELLP